MATLLRDAQFLGRAHAVFACSNSFRGIDLSCVLLARFEMKSCKNASGSFAMSVSPSVFSRMQQIQNCWN
jgi:hypothetical protein